jgi:hypothetical protein
MSRRDAEKRYFRAVGVVARLKSKLYVLGAKQSLLEGEINKATAEVVRLKQQIENEIIMTPAEQEMAKSNRLMAIKMVRERLPNLDMKKARDLVDETCPPTYRS